MHLTCIVGARPNFMKVAPILEAAKKSGLETRLVHTGQHYDEKMSALFFEELGLPQPDVYFGVGGGSHAIQTGKVLISFDETLDRYPTDLVLVVGDVNSTLACALVAIKRSVRVAHVEAGLRSHDRTMPEEINRILTDQISEFLFTSERDAASNLLHEGIPEERIHFVGNVMIDTLLKHRDHARRRGIVQELGLVPRGYGICTLHRPSNVDSEAAAGVTMNALELVAERVPVVFPLHPRTRNRFESFGLLKRIVANVNVHLVDPLGYLDFLALMDQARLVFTDSGGIQEETTVLGVPCLTFRENTERPATISQGTNRLVGTDPAALTAALDDLFAGRFSAGNTPEMWDGHTAERIVKALRAS